MLAVVLVDAFAGFLAVLPRIFRLARSWRPGAPPRPYVGCRSLPSICDGARPLMRLPSRLAVRQLFSISAHRRSTAPHLRGSWLPSDHRETGAGGRWAR